MFTYVIDNNYLAYFLLNVISATNITRDKAKPADMIVKGKIRYCRPSTSRSSLADETLREESRENSFCLGFRSRPNCNNYIFLLGKIWGLKGEKHLLHKKDMPINLLPPCRSFPEDPAVVIRSDGLPADVKHWWGQVLVPRISKG